MLPVRLPTLTFLGREGTSGRPEDREIIQLSAIGLARLQNLSSLWIVFDSCVLDTDQAAVRTPADEIRCFGISDQNQFLAGGRRSRRQKILEMLSFGLLAEKRHIRI